MVNICNKGKESEKEKIDIHVSSFVVYLKLTEHCKPKVLP